MAHPAPLARRAAGLDAFGLTGTTPGDVAVCGHGHPLKRHGIGTYCGVCHFTWNWTGDAQGLAKLPWVGRKDPFRGQHCSDCGRHLDRKRCVACDPRCPSILTFEDGGAICLQPPHLDTADGHVWSRTFYHVLNHPGSVRWGEIEDADATEAPDGADDAPDEAHDEE